MSPCCTGFKNEPASREHRRVRGLSSSLATEGTNEGPFGLPQWDPEGAFLLPWLSGHPRLEGCLTLLDGRLGREALPVERQHQQPDGQP